MIRGSCQDVAFREFCRKKHYQPHKSLPLFQIGSDKRWILYRHGTKHPQPMKEEKEIFPGWTFSKSKGNAREQELYHCVCLHCDAFPGVGEEVWFVRRRVFENCIEKISAKRIYIPKESKRDAFDPERQKLLSQFHHNPVFD